MMTDNDSGATISIGIHVLGELYGIDDETLSYVENIEPLVSRVLQECEFHVLTSSFHQFQPVGVTGVFLLSESHLSVHTWPQKSCLALDIFSCGSAERALCAFEALVRELAPTRVQKRMIERALWEAHDGAFERRSLASDVPAD